MSMNPVLNCCNMFRFSSCSTCDIAHGARMRSFWKCKRPTNRLNSFILLLPSTVIKNDDFSSLFGERWTLWQNLLRYYRHYAETEMESIYLLCTYNSFIKVPKNNYVTLPRIGLNNLYAELNNTDRVRG